MAHFSEFTHPEYDELHDKWTYSWDHYTGKYMDTGKIEHYLNQKKQRESNTAFDVRKKESDPILHFPTAVDGLCGIVFSKSDDTTREWGALGDPEDEGSTAHKLFRNADGGGTNWQPLFREVAIRQTVMHTVWGLVEGVEVVEDEDGNTVETLSEAQVKVINPQSVVNWYPDTNPREVLVKESRDIRQSLLQQPEEKDVYTLYTLDGWRRFYMDQDESGNSVERVIDEGSYEYWASSRKNQRVLPIFRVSVPMPRFVGYLLAQKQNHIFNFKSSRDAGAQNISYALLKLVGSKKQTDTIANKLESGVNYITQFKDAQSDHEYIAPPSDHLNACAEILDKDVEHFYVNAFKEYGDAAAQRTATEIRLESQTGIEAFLSLLVSSLDEFENQCFLRINQVYFPDRPDVWGDAFVKRSTEFQPKDEEQAIQNLKNQFFGEREPVPATAEQKAEIVKRILESKGIDVEDMDALQRAIEQQNGMMPEDQMGG
jgi:hypothetical protein